MASDALYSPLWYRIAELRPDEVPEIEALHVESAWLRAMVHRLDKQDP